MRAVALMLLTVAAVFLSACAQAPGETLDTQTPSDGATVKGLVVSEEVFPVAGANVTIIDGPSTLTDADGSFVFEGVAPGRITLNATADGYAGAEEEITVSAGATVDLLLRLTGLAGESPYLTTIIHEGYLACDFSAVYSAQPIPPGSVADCPFGDRNALTSVNVTADWRAGVHEIAWETQEELIFSSSLANSCLAGADSSDACPFLGWGPSPIQVFARPNDAEYASQHAIDGEATWPESAHESFIFAGYSGYFRSEINETANPVCVVINNQFSVPEHWGCPFGIGYTTGLRMTMYHTTFYLQEPPALEQFTAVPDQ